MVARGELGSGSTVPDVAAGHPRMTGGVSGQVLTAVGVFSDHESARSAVAELRNVGFTENEIGVASRQTGAHVAGETRTSANADDDTNAGEGAVAGLVTGAGVGGLWALGIAAGVLPAIGPAIAGGVLASILSSAAVAGAAGGIVGALIGLGIPEEDARHYESEFSSGRTIVTVRTDGPARFDAASDVLRRFGGNVNSRASASSTGY